MTIEVEIITFNLTGHKSISPPPSIVRKVRAYVQNARLCGLSDAEIAQDAEAFWPNPRRVIEVETEASGDMRVLIMPSKALLSPPPARFFGQKAKVEANPH